MNVVKIQEDFAFFRLRLSSDTTSIFSHLLVTGTVADEYLKKHGASVELLKDPAWVKNDPDTVANAVFDW